MVTKHGYSKRGTSSNLFWFDAHWFQLIIHMPQKHISMTFICFIHYYMVQLTKYWGYFLEYCWIKCCEELISIVFISCVINSGWVGIGLGNGLVPQATSHYVSQWWPIPMSSSDVSGLGDGLVLVWVMAWCCWRQAITWATDNSYYIAMWRDSVNSSPASAAYTRQWTGSALVQVMTCRLSGAKPLPELMLAYCRMDSLERISMIFESKFYHVHSCKCIWNCHLPKWQPFCPRQIWVQMSWLWPSFCLSHSYQDQQCKTWGYFFSWNIASSNLFSISIKMLMFIVYPLRGTQLVTEIWRLTSWIRRLTSCILLRGPS